MSSFAWGFSLPYQRVARWRRRGNAGWPELPRPSISVGNLAFGGRGKTPLVAAITQEALSAGLRPAILTRGYGGRVRGPGSPEVLRGASKGPSWLQPISGTRKTAGEEACWLAATCPGVPVGVGPDRGRSAAKILSTGMADLFILDDGFQTATQRDVDVVLLDSTLDPPFVARRTPLREGSEALRRASALGIISRKSGPPVGEHAATKGTPCFGLTRTFHSLRRLVDGSVLGRADWPAEVLVAAAGGQPGSVEEVLCSKGIHTARTIRLRDHARPTPYQLRRLRSSQVPVVITEKDAISWGSTSLQEALVLEVFLDGAPALGRWAIDKLNL